MATFLAAVVVFIVSIWVFNLLGYRKKDHLLLPGLLGYWFQYVSALLVPGLWQVGWGAPWEDLTNETTAIAVSSGFCLAALGGIWFAQRRPMSVMWYDQDRPTISGLAGGAGLILAFGGVGLLYLVSPSLFEQAGTLVRRQSDGLTAGNGPIYALFTLALWVALLAPRRSLADKLVIVVAILLFSVTVFLTGQKSRFAILVFALFVRELCSQFRDLDFRHLRKGAILLSATILATSIYNVEVRAGGVMRVIPGIDPTSRLGYIEYNYSRFIQSTFDMTRTVGRTQELLGGDTVRFHTEPLIGSVLNPIPSVIIKKPPPASQDFSRELFGEVWSRGTGIPPSLASELTWYFGTSMALWLYFLFFFLLARWGFRMTMGPRPSPIAYGVRILSLVSVIMLLKGGSDGALRLFVTFAMGLVLLSFVDKTLRRTVPGAISVHDSYSNTALTKGGSVV